jgi:hypothetical protein
MSGLKRKNTVVVHANDAGEILDPSPRWALSSKIPGSESRQVSM